MNRDEIQSFIKEMSLKYNFKIVFYSNSYSYNNKQFPFFFLKIHNINCVSLHNILMKEQFYDVIYIYDELHNCTNVKCFIKNKEQDVKDIVTSILNRLELEINPAKYILNQIDC